MLSFMWYKVIDFWKSSYDSDKVAFFVELVSVIFTIIGSTTLAISAASPDMRIIYPLYFVGSVTGMISSYRRKMAWIFLLCGYFSVANIFGFIVAMGVL